MAQLPDNIASILGVDFSGNIVNIDTSFLTISRDVQSTVVSQIRIPTIEEQEQVTNKTTVITNNITPETEPFLILADSFYIPLVNADKTNFTNSVMYQIGGKIGVNNNSPRFLFDVKGGSINVTNTANVNTYGYRIDGKNVAYSQGLYNTIVMGNTTDHSIVRVNSLAIGNMDIVPPTGVGIMSWNDQDGTVDLTLKGGNVTLQIGQEQLTRVVNKTGLNLLESSYQVVRISGAQGNRLKVGLAMANNDANSAETLGVVTETINDNQEGFITTSGLVRNINTTGSLQGETWTDGDMLYLSGTVSGALTNIKPQAPTHTVIMGYVVRAHQTQGQIYVKVDNGYEIDELHNVKITSVANKDFLHYDSATSVWKNAQFDSIMTIGGEVSGTYSNMVLVNNAVTAKVLTNYTLTSGTVSSADSILTAFGKLQNQINGLSGSLVYKGTWDASTNTPTITSGTGTNGNFYIVSVAGSTTIDGTSTWAIGDWIIFNGTVWQRIVNSAVTSVNGKTGVVTLTTTDISEGTNLYYTNARAISALTGAISTVTTTNLNNNIVVVSNGTGKLTSSSITTTELGYLSGVTSGIQAQINTKQNILTIGNLTEATSSVLTITGGTGAVIGSGTTIQVKQASVSQSGFLSSGDFSNFNSAYSFTNAFPSQATHSGKFLTTNGTSLSWATIPTPPVTSVFGRTGAVVATSGDYTTAQVTESGNLYFTNARAIASTLTGFTSNTGVISASDTILTAIQKLNGNIGALVTGVSSVNGTANRITVSSTTGAVIVNIASTYSGQTSIVTLGTITTGTWNASSITDAYISSSSNWNTAYTFVSNFPSQTGNSGKYLTTNGTSLSWVSINAGVTSVSGTTNRVTVSPNTGAVVVDIASTYTGQASIVTVGTITTGTWNGTAISDTYISSASNWNSAFSNRITSLTTTGNSGSATLVSNVLNIPNYTLTGLGGVPTSRTLTINGISYDLSTNASWTIPTSSITGSGTENYLVKWGATAGTLTNGSIVDTGSTVSFFSQPPQPYFFNVRNNVASGKYLSFWAPTDSNGAYQTGLLSHNGNGLFDQAPLYFNASEFSFGIGISAALSIDSSRNVRVNGANVFGGGRLQVNGDVNITGQFLVNGSPITTGGGGGAVSSVFGRTGAISAQFGDYNIGQISGISISGATAGQVLTFNGSNWVNAAPTGGGGGGGATYLYQLLDVNVSGQTVGQALVWNGSQWTNQTVSGGGGGGNFVSGTGDINKIALFNGVSNITSSIITQNGTSSITIAGTVTATSYFEPSDLRLKDIISRDGDVIKFTWSDKRDDIIHIGYVAQEIRSEYPDQVIMGEDGYLKVNYTEVLVDKVARLERRVKELESKLN